VDDFSRYTWLCLIRSKNEVIVVLRDFIALIKNQFALSVKILRSDNGTEFFNSSVIDLLASNGIIHHSSCVYTPQQNGTVERKHRHILEVARALRFQSFLPIQFWGECVRTAVYLINKLPTDVLKGRSPYEVLHQKIPKLSHLRVFGCLCYATRLPKGDKFAPRARKSVFLGYSETQQGYRLYDLIEKVFFVSRVVTFREDIFLSKDKHCLQSLICLR